MLTVLGGLAEFERELIRARTSEGRERAKARGQSLGRPFKLTRTSGARRFAAAIGAKRSATSLAATTSTPARFHGSPLEATLVCAGSLNSIVPLRPDLPEIDTSLDRHGFCPSRRSEFGNDAVDGTTATADYKHVLYYPA
jgi:hypothetical protein